MDGLKTRSARLTDQWVGEGYFDLCLRIGELVALQEKTGIGPHALANRFATDGWMVQDVLETMRLALIGGGMHQREAFDLVNRAVIPGYFAEYAATAFRVVLAALSGVEEEPLPGEVDAPLTTETETHAN